MTTDFSFAYGSNINYSDLRSWLERNGHDSSLVVNRWVATLDGHDFIWNYYSSSRAGGAANLEPKDGSIIWGVLLEFDESLLKAFDRKEGHPYFYSRGNRRVSVVRQEDNQEIPAWLYRAAPNKGNRKDVWPTAEYKKIILDGAVEMKFPEEYLARIREWPVSR